jgi:hypothetical protein
MLPLIAALKDWKEWDQSHVIWTVEQIAIQTVKQIIAEMECLPENTRSQCRTVINTKTALEAAHAASDSASAVAEKKLSGLHAMRAASEASWAAAEAAWGTKRVGETTFSAAKAAAHAAQAAVAEKTSPDNILRAACQLWIKAAS